MKFLIATDGSTASDRALEYAASLVDTDCVASPRVGSRRWPTCVTKKAGTSAPVREVRRVTFADGEPRAVACDVRDDEPRATG